MKYRVKMEDGSVVEKDSDITYIQASDCVDRSCYGDKCGNYLHGEWYTRSCRLIGDKCITCNHVFVGGDEAKVHKIVIPIPFMSHLALAQGKDPLAYGSFDTPIGVGHDCKDCWEKAL